MFSVKLILRVLTKWTAFAPCLMWCWFWEYRLNELHQCDVDFEIINEMDCIDVMFSVTLIPRVLRLNCVGAMLCVTLILNVSTERTTLVPCYVRRWFWMYRLKGLRWRMTWFSDFMTSASFVVMEINLLVSDIISFLVAPCSALLFLFDILLSSFLLFSFSSPLYRIKHVAPM